MKLQHVKYNLVLFIVDQDDDKWQEYLKSPQLRYPTPLFSFANWANADKTLPNETHGPLTSTHHGFIKPVYAYGTYDHTTRSVTFTPQFGRVKPLTVPVASLATRFLGLGMSVYLVKNDTISTLTGKWFDNAKFDQLSGKELPTMDWEEFNNHRELDVLAWSHKLQEAWADEKQALATEWLKATGNTGLFLDEPLERPFPQHLELVGAEGSPNDGKLRIPIHYHPTVIAFLSERHGKRESLIDGLARVNAEVTWTLPVYEGINADGGIDALADLFGSYRISTTLNLRAVFATYKRRQRWSGWPLF